MTNHLPQIEIITLPYGLKLVHRHEQTEVEYFGATINAGSRDDPKDLPGLAHFVEHVIFKGTTHRRSWHIINRMESCGGELNAFTTKETTTVYSVFPTGNFDRAAELIADLMCNSIFPESELEKERDIVADEINQYLDFPAEAVYDDFEDHIFEYSELGHNILGDISSLKKFDSSVCGTYLLDNFTANRTVLFYAGPLGIDKVARKVSRYFTGLPEGLPLKRQRPHELDCSHFKASTGNHNHQAHTVAGARIPDMYSPERWTWSLLANILGGPGMNSLLNVELRERRGLVYSVEASSSFLTDTGLLTIYFGCDHDDVDRCLRLIRNTVGRISRGKLTDRFIEAAKKQYIGQLTLVHGESRSVLRLHPSAQRDC